MIPVLSLDTEHLRLDPFCTADYEYIVYVHEQSPRTTMDDVDHFRNDAEFLAYIENVLAGNATGWVLSHRQTGIRLGVVYFVDVLSSVTANFHPVLDLRSLKELVPTDGNGHRLRVMDEASREAIRYAVKVFSLQRVGAAFGAHNVQAIKLCERLGFQREGKICHGLRIDQQPVDLVLLGILSKEVLQWPSAQQQQS